MRLSNYLKSVFLEAIKKSFGECEVVLYGSRVDDNKKGGDFDIAIKGDFSKEEFKKGKIRFLKELLMQDLDLPIDLVAYNLAPKALQEEIDKKGIKLN